MLPAFSINPRKMPIALLSLSPSSLLPISSVKPHYHPLSLQYLQKHHHLFLIPTKHHKFQPHNLKPRPISSQSNKNSFDVPDRLISAVCYFYPFLDGIQYGKFITAQFPPIQILLQPLLPPIRLFKSFPLTGFLLFLILYISVVRNPNISRYVRFNTMQAMVLDVLLIFPGLLERTFSPSGGLGMDVVMSLDSTVFLFLLVSLIYGSGSCLLGQVPRLPIVAEAAERQVL